MASLGYAPDYDSPDGRTFGHPARAKYEDEIQSAPRASPANLQTSSLNIVLPPLWKMRLDLKHIGPLGV